MSLETASQYGVKMTIKGLLATFLILIFLSFTFLLNANYGLVHIIITALDWKVGIFLASLVLSGIFFGRLAGREIYLKKKNPWLSSVKTIMLVLLFSLLSTTSFVYLISDHADTGNFVVFLLRPLILFALYGSIPAIILFVWLGLQLNKILN
jgi:hypothetical protein